MILSYKNLYDRRKFALITDLVFFALAYKGSFFFIATFLTKWKFIY